jgi:hypothetical protein
VSVGRAQPGRHAATFTFDAAPEARAAAVGSLIALLRSHPALDVHVVATARTQHGAIRAARQTVDLAQSTAKAELVGQTPRGARQQANLQSKLGDAEMAAAKLQAAQRRIDEWHRGHGDADPAQQLAVVDAALARARAATPQDDLRIAQLQEQQAELASAETTFSRLLDQHDAADRAAKRTKAAFDRAESLAGTTNAGAQAEVVASDVREAVVDKARPQGRLAIAAILLYADETSRARRARRRRQRQQRRAHKPRNHRPSTAHSWHAWQADIDLTDEQRGDPGGPRAAELRDVRDPDDVPAQHPQE